MVLSWYSDGGYLLSGSTGGVVYAWNTKLIEGALSTGLDTLVPPHQQFEAHKDAVNGCRYDILELDLYWLDFNAFNPHLIHCQNLCIVLTQHFHYWLLAQVKGHLMSVLTLIRKLTV